MGNIIMPSGLVVPVDGGNTTTLSFLIVDAVNSEYTNSYRISVIQQLGKLGKHAGDALPTLKELSNSDNSLIKNAAKQAIENIEKNGGKSDGVTVAEGPFRDTWTGTALGSKKAVKGVEINTVTITPLEVSDSLQDNEVRVHYRCDFCEKLSLANKQQQRFSSVLTKKYFCNFCIRHDQYTKFNSNIMILTFRGLIGYYYHAYYMTPKVSSMHLTDIGDYIHLHYSAGLQNPTFKIDPETLCWFVDFTKIGPKKVPVDAVLETIVDILATFNLYENVKCCSPIKLYKKYEDAVMQFYKERVRVNGDKIFSPTLMACDLPVVCPSGARPIAVDVLQGFIPSHLVDKHKRF